MRLVRVSMPDGKSDAVAAIAFGAGVSEVSVRIEKTRSLQGEKTKEVMDVSTATPTAKAFLDALLAAPLFDPAQYSIAVRQPRSLLSRDGVERLTYPLVEPGTDLLEELWQFSHITAGFAGRILIGAGLLGYGLLKDKLLLIVAGLMFLPLLPLVLGIAFGGWTRAWRLVCRAALALLTGVALTFAAAALIGLMVGPPILHRDFNSMLSSGLISLAVGVAAALAAADDAGRRELIGLAAAAQLAILPAWLGVELGAGVDADVSVLLQRALTLGLNIVAIVVGSGVTFAALRFRSITARAMKSEPST